MDETVTTESPTATPIWFWTVGVILVLWNLAGLAAFGFIMSMVGNEDALEVAGMNEAQIQLIMETPIWVNVAFGVATIFGLLGCISLVIRKSVAIPMLIVSLLGVLAQSSYVFFLSNSVEVMGVGLSPVVIPIAIVLVPYALFCTKQPWWTYSQ